MKYFILVFTVLFLVSCNSKKEYTITGSFTDTQTEEWIFLHNAFSEELILDSARIIDGSFQFSGTIEQPDIYALSYNMQRSKGICLFILEPEDLKVEINSENWNNMGNIVLGGKHNNDFNKYSKVRNERFTNKIHLLVESSNKIDETEKNKTSEQLDKLLKAQTNHAIDYIKSHPESPVSISLLMEIYFNLSLEEQFELLEILSPLKKMTVYRMIKSDYETQLALEEKTPVYNYNTSSPLYKDLNLINNSVIKSLIKNNPGKILYIDTWSTTCGPCFKEFPYSNILHNKFEKDVEFIYLCFGAEDKNDWMDKIKKYELSGQHYLLSEKLGVLYYSEIGRNIIATPHYVIINKDGEITHDNAPRPSMKEIEPLLKKIID